MKSMNLLLFLILLSISLIIEARGPMGGMGSGGSGQGGGWSGGGGPGRSGFGGGFGGSGPGPYYSPSPYASPSPTYSPSPMPSPSPYYNPEDALIDSLQGKKERLGIDETVGVWPRRWWNPGTWYRYIWPRPEDIRQRKSLKQYVPQQQEPPQTDAGGQGHAVGGGGSI